MINIRPVSDLRNKFPEIEKIVETGEPVFLTKNGYGSMVALSLEQYAALTEGTPQAITSPLPGRSTTSASDADSAPDSPHTSFFKNAKKQKKTEEPQNPELAREAQEKALGTHTMLDKGVLPLPSSTTIRF